MQDLGALTILRLPLQILWEFPDIATRIRQERLTLEDDFRRWYGNYDPTTQGALLAQLRWAIAHPSYDFTSVLKKVKTSNEDILVYFRFLEQLFAGLLAQH